MSNFLKSLLVKVVFIDSHRTDNQATCSNQLESYSTQRIENASARPPSLTTALCDLEL